MEADINPTPESWVLLGKLLPGHHKHLKCWERASKNWICLVRHDLLDMVRDLLLLLDSTDIFVYPSHTSKTT
jgi:hypothetical protein